MNQTIVNGRPTGPSVEKVLEEIGKMADGDQIAYSRLETIINAERPNGHFSAVMVAVKKKLLLLSGRVLVNERGEGYRVATGEQQILNASRGIKKKTELLVTECSRIAAVSDERLPDPISQKKRDHMIEYANRITSFAIGEVSKMRLELRKTEPRLQ